MRNIEIGQSDTPPSSINGDEINVMDEEDLINLDEMEEYPMEDDDEMEEMIELDMEDPPEDLSALVFDKHVGSVFSCDIHPNGKLAATGGEDDKAFAWSVETGQLIMECVGHKDSVIFVGFSFDGVYLATADMSGIIKVWKCNLEENQQEPWSVAFEYEADDLLWCQWHFAARVLLCGTVNGNIYVFKIPSGDIKVLQGHNSRTECGKLFKDGVRLAAGYEDGAVKVWDLKTCSVVHQVPAGTHEIRVTAIDTHYENNLIASISTDGKVLLTTAINGKIVGQLEAENDLEAVAFSEDPQLPFFALGTLNGSVTIWDIAHQMVRHNCAKSTENVDAGVTKMIWIKNNLVTGCLDGSIRVYEGRSGEKVLTLTGNSAEVLDLCYNEKENLILTTSDDGTARIFKYDIKKE